AEAGLTAMSISAATHEGVQELMNRTSAMLRELREEEAERQAVEATRALSAGPVLRPEPEEAFSIERIEDGFRVRGKRVERMVAMTNPDSYDGMQRLEKQLRKLGVFAALEEQGVQPGDTIRFGKTEMVWGEEM